MGRVKFILTVFLTYFVVSGKFVLCSCFNYADHKLDQCFKDELVVSYMLLVVWGWLQVIVVVVLEMMEFYKWYKEATCSLLDLQTTSRTTTILQTFRQTEKL